jgi:hypothetical protein
VSTREVLPLYGAGVLVGAFPLTIAARATKEAVLAAWVCWMMAADT